MKKYAALILAVICIAGCFASCSSGNTAGSITDAVSSGTEAATTLPAETEEAPVLPEGAYYDGYEFRVLVSGNMSKNDFQSDEIGSDVLSDAIYRKNAAVEAAYGIHITNTDVTAFGTSYGAGPGYMQFAKSYQSGSFDYDMGMIGSYDVCVLAYTGMLTDLNSLPYLDCGRPWWDQEARKALTISDKLFFTTGDISLTDNVFTNCILFSKELIRTNASLLDPYELVRSGKWTYDTMGTEVKKVTEDIDGNHLYNENDKYGLLTWNDAILSVVNSGGSRVCRVDEYGDLELTLHTDRTLSVMEKYADFAFTNCCLNYQSVTTTVSAWDPMRTKIFDENRALYYMSTFNAIPMHRDKETDFGILPYPKYDETQETYGNLVSSFHMQFFCVPALVEDEERTGTLTEYLAYTSLKIMTPAYYDKTLIGTLIRDDESAEMLDLIFATRVFDIGLYYRVGDYQDAIMQIAKNKNPSSFESLYMAKEAAAQSQINNINKKFSEVIKDNQ